MTFEQEARVMAPPEVVLGLTKDYAKGAVEPMARGWFSPETRLRAAALDRAIASGQR